MRSSPTRTWSGERRRMALRLTEPCAIRASLFMGPRELRKRFPGKGIASSSVVACTTKKRVPSDPHADPVPMKGPRPRVSQIHHRQRTTVRHLGDQLNSCASTSGSCSAS